MSALKPTDEQEAILRAGAEIARAGHGTLKVVAGAGAGKTTTLVMLAQQMVRAGLRAKPVYLAFNRAIVEDSQARFLSSADCRTIHSLALAGLSRGGRRINIRKRAESTRDIARATGLDDEGARLVQGTLSAYCTDTTRDPEEAHLPPDVPRGSERAREILDVAREYFLATCQVGMHGKEQLSHDFYLKWWHREGCPGLEQYGAILLDEAQDANPLIVDAVRRAPIAVLVGDPLQQIYSWRGAVNIMSLVDTPHVYPLMQSWRFGANVARVANGIMLSMDQQQRWELRGNPAIDSQVLWPDQPGLGHRDPHTRVYRTNGAAVEEGAVLADLGQHVALVGQRRSDLLRHLEDLFAASRGLWRRVKDPEILEAGGFEEARRVLLSSRSNTARQAVELWDHYARAPERLIAMLKADEDPEGITITTAHLSKGRQWPRVVVASDFDPLVAERRGDEELCIAYVAVTRAEHHLEIKSTLVGQMGRLLF